MYEIIDSLFTTGIFTALILLPGFLSIFFPFKILGIKLGYTKFELTLLSLLISFLIFALSLITYQLILPPMNIENITIIGLIFNSKFALLFIFYTIFFIFIGFYFITKDRLQKFRKKLTGKDIIIKPDEYIWDDVFDNYPGYYHIVETNNNEIFFGFIICHTSGLKEKEILLKYPRKYDRKTDKYIKIEDSESILFLNSDIRRIHFVPPKSKT